MEINQKIGRFTIISFDNCDKDTVFCKCDCGNYKYVNKRQLERREVKSCGCLRREIAKSKLRHIHENKLFYRNPNKYSEIMEDINGKFIIGYTTNNQDEFYIDLSDYDKIKDYAWRTYIDKRNGFKSVCTTISQRIDNKIKYNRISLQHFLGYYYCDHIDRNELNNRIYNLRKCNQTQNIINSTKSKLNTSGFIGVTFISKTKKWRSYISINKKRQHLGTFKEKDDAIKARLEAEAKYFGEYAPQIDLFEQYGIEKPKIKSLADEVC